MVCYLTCVYPRQPQKHASGDSLSHFGQSWQPRLRGETYLLPAISNDSNNDSSSSSAGLLPESSVTNSEGRTMLMNDIPNVDQNAVLSKNVTDNLFEVQDQALIESLSRDVLLATGSWTSTDPEIAPTMDASQLTKDFNQPFLKEIILPDDIVSKSAFIAAKLANVAFMRSDYEITVRVQATPFLQGALWLWNKMNSQQTSVLRRTLTEHLRSITSFPGIEMNLQSESRAITLSVPFTSEFQVYNPRNTNGLNSIRLSVLSKLQGIEDVEKASYSIYGRLKNIKLYGHAPSETSSSYPSTQGGTDEDSSSQGIVSRVADTVGTIANTVEGLGVPVLSSIAKPVSWVSGVVRNVASMFGFSKDRDMTKVTAYENLPAKGFTHGVGFDYGVPLSLLPNNAIDPTIAVSEGLDEMAIEYLAQRPYVLQRYTIKGGDSPDATKTVIADIPISPVNYSLYGSLVNGYRTLFAAPSSLAVATANWWRGMINLNLRFAKTQYHQCRLLVQYLPYGSGVQPIENVLSQIVDVSAVDDKGIDISFPSVYPNKWMRSYDPALSGYTAGCAPGRIVISVLNPLISAPTVASDIIMYPWVSWKNLQVAEPGTLAKAAIGFDYPVDVPSDPIFSVATAPPSGTLFTLLQDTTVSLASSNELYRLDFRNSTTGTLYTLAFTGLSNELGYCDEIKLPQGEYTVTYDDGTPPTLITNYPIISAPIGPSYSAHDFVSGDTFTISDDTLITCASAQANNDFSVSLVKNSEETKILDYSSVGFTSPVPQPFEAGTYKVSLNGVGRVTLISNIPLVDFPRPLTHAGEDITPTWFTKFMRAICRVLRKHVLKSPLCIYPEVQAGLDYSEPDSSSLLTTMGEQYSSLRMLSRRSSPVDIVRGASVTLPGISFGTDNSLRQSLVNVISYMYRFTHGSISYKIIPKDKGDLFVTTVSPDVVESNPNAYQFDTNRAMHFINTSLNPVAQVTLPFYSPAENLVLDSRSFPQLSDLVIGNLDRSENEYFVLASAGDDHTFSQLAGCPAFTYGPSRV